MMETATRFERKDLKEPPDTCMMEETGRLIKFLYNEDHEVVAEETSNGTITRYIRGLGIISSDSKGRNTGILSPEDQMVYKAVYDRQGSITHVLSEDAEILNRYS